MGAARKLLGSMFRNRGGLIQGLNGEFREDFVEAALKSYVETAIWSSTDEDGKSFEQLNYDEGDIDPGALDLMRKDVRAFIRGNVRDIGDLSASKVGHNFWLTRNRHGAGFWDLGLGARGKKLTDAAHAYGESDLYVGDDGILYIN